MSESWGTRMASPVGAGGSWATYTRSAHTRQLVLDAVVGILHQRGFPALTNALIIEQTGISSGALMHHFPTREKLLTGMVEYAYVTLSTFRHEQFSRLTPGLPRFRSLIDMAWHTASIPAGFALNEVRNGARSDQAIADLVACAVPADGGPYQLRVDGAVAPHPHDGRGLPCR